MKHILITTIAAVLLVGCGPSVDIWTAADKGNIEAVKQHIAAGTDLGAKDKHGRTPLHLAANSGHPVELLIAAGADVNAKSNKGWTPLHSAAYGGNKEIAELLIAKGAEVDAIIKSASSVQSTAAKNFFEGKTPLDMASGKTADLLRKHGGKTGAELKAEGK